LILALEAIYGKQSRKFIMPRAQLRRNINIISVPKDFAKLTAITKDGFFVYKIKYLVDPVKAVRNRTFTVKIHGSERPFVRPRQRTFQNFNSRAIVRTLRLRRAIQKDTIRTQRQLFIFSVTSDITKKIPNNRTIQLSRARFTRRPFVRTTLRVRPALVADLRSQNLELPVFDQNRNRLEESDTTFSTRAIRAAGSSLVMARRRDPAQLVGTRTHSFLSAVRGFSGTVPRRPTPAQLRIQPSRVLVGTVLNRRSISNQLQLQASDFVNIVTREENQTIEIEETVNIPVGDLDEDEFFMVFQLKNRFGVTQQTLTKKIPHSRNVASLEIPVDPPEVTALQAGQIGKTALDIRQKDVNATAVKIYRRPFNKTQPALDATYDFVGTVDIDDKDGLQRVEDVFASTSPIIYRVVPVNSSGMLGADFGSVVVQQQRGNVAKRSKFLKRPHFISISHAFQENSIVITLRDFPPEPIALRLLRKDRTIKEQENTQIGDVTLTDRDTNAPLFFEDTTVKEDRIYEYNVEFFYKDGATEFAATNLIVEYCPVVSNIVQLEISEPIVDETGDELDVQFTIEKDVIKTEGDLIKTFLQEQGLLSEFQDQVIANRDTLQELFAVRVTRTNVSTGELEDFGIIQSPKFSDRKFGRVKAVKPLDPGFDYRYNITAHARDAETLFKTLQKTVEPRLNVSYTFKPFEFRHPITLSRGNLVTATSLKRNHSKTTFTFGRVVDVKVVDVSLADVLPSLYDGKANIFGEDSVLVQWKVQGNVNKIDHFIVTLESLGIRTIIGKSHNITNSNSFQLVDKLTNKECGELKYVITPVFYDFSHGSELLTNQVVI
jgi:hypothetical protein